VNLKEKQLFIFDLDGVIYLGNEPIPGAKKVLDFLTTNKKKFYYLTNNSTKTRTQFKEKLLKMGINASEQQIITSAYATAKYLQRQPVGPIYVIGEIGLINELRTAGFSVITEDTSNEQIKYVVVGLDRNFTYQKLAYALTALERGAKFIATNADPTLPTEYGILPGAGSMVAALSTAANISPMIIIGKPNTFMVDLILNQEKIPPSQAIIVGDRYTTDIMAGINANIKTILVKSGAGIKEIKLIPPSGPNPDLILNSIAEILNYF